MHVSQQDAVSRALNLGTQKDGFKQGFFVANKEKLVGGFNPFEKY